MEFGGGGCKSTAGEGGLFGKSMDKREGREGWLKYWGREVKGRLRPGGRRRLKSFPPSWTMFSARGQKKAKMLHFFSLRLPCQPASASVSFAVCFQMSSEPLWATVDRFASSSVEGCLCLWVCVWELENFVFLLLLRLVMSCIWAEHTRRYVSDPSYLTRLMHLFLIFHSFCHSLPFFPVSPPLCNSLHGGRILPLNYTWIMKDERLVCAWLIF